MQRHLMACTSYFAAVIQVVSPLFHSLLWCLEGLEWYA
jgi:hypothetical protein